MEKLNDINEAVSYLREGDIVTCNGKDQFIMKEERIHRYSEGTHFSMELQEFMELYKKTGSIFMKNLWKSMKARMKPITDSIRSNRFFISFYRSFLVQHRRYRR